jgi:hypothetical protein
MWGILGASWGFGLEKSVFMSSKHNAAPNGSIRVDNGSLEVRYSSNRTKRYVCVQINTRFWRCLLLPNSGNKFLSSRLLSDISWGSTTGFSRTAEVRTVRTGNCTKQHKCTLFIINTHSSHFCYMFRHQLHHHLQGKGVCQLHISVYCWRAGQCGGLRVHKSLL